MAINIFSILGVVRSEIFTFTHDMKLKFWLGIPLDKRSWSMTSSGFFRVQGVFHRLECIFADIIKIWKLRYQSTSFVNGTNLWKFQVDTTPISKDIAWSLFFPKILVSELWSSLNMKPLRILTGHLMGFLKF